MYVIMFFKRDLVMLLEEIKSVSSTSKDVRKFGVTIGAVLLVIAGVLFWKGKPSYLYFGVAAFTLAALGLLVPMILRPLYRAWMAFAVVMGFIMTRVILTVLFFGLFTPIAFVVKLLGKDLLSERIDKNATTYWVKRERQPYAPESSERMF
jgi:hypothetical protein